MGTISLEHIDNLFWLGRYTERVYTTLSLYFDSYDSMIDMAGDYRIFCEKLDIPDIYGGAEEFRRRYPFDAEDPNSILSNMTRAYDNGIIMREILGSEALAYIQMTIYDIQAAKVSEAPLLALQDAIDHIMAFWGIMDDKVDNPQVRNVLKAGKRIERIDLYARLGMDGTAILRELERLAPRVAQSGMRYHREYLDEIREIAETEPVDEYRIVSLIEDLVIMM
ncbi:MAG: alpha-E domain-containing protein [Lachnospiraceae bacterium]|nr:alpha-E domain-containing protein [Lachnospiraceae bacterium]